MVNNAQRNMDLALNRSLSAVDFNKWQALIERQVGVVIAHQSRGFLQLALVSRMRALGINDPSHYYQRLACSEGNAFEWSRLLAGLTVQETCFFRHRPAFDFLKQYLQERSASPAKRPLMLWSVGCASGEEAYSLAITSFEVLRSSKHFGVLASDVSEAALARARAGRYSARSMHNVPTALRERYFVFDRSQNHFAVSAELAARVCFTRLNVLMLAEAPFFDLDVIFCQNLLIYFKRSKRFEILNQLVGRLSSGGVLLIGAGEATLWQHPELVAVAGGAVQAFVRKQAGCAE